MQKEFLLTVQAPRQALMPRSEVIFLLDHSHVCLALCEWGHLGPMMWTGRATFPKFGGPQVPAMKTEHPVLFSTLLTKQALSYDSLRRSPSSGPTAAQHSHPANYPTIRTLFHKCLFKKLQNPVEARMPFLLQNQNAIELHHVQCHIWAKAQLCLGFHLLNRSSNACCISLSWEVERMQVRY